MEKELAKVDAKGIVASVNDSVCQIKTIEKKIATTVKAAEKAKKSADKAANFERKIFQRTTAGIVDALQPAVKDIAHAVEVSVETQKLLFEHEKILAEACQSLFAMGVSNIAATSITVKQIKMQLQNASEEEISDMARKELERVVAQLQMQEDLFNRQNKLTEKVKVVNAKVEGINDSLDEHDKKIERQNKKIDNLKKQTAEEADALKQKDEQLEELVNDNWERLNQMDVKDLEQDKRIKHAEQLGRERDRRLDKKDEKDEEHDRRLSEKDEKDKEHDRRLNEKDEKDKEHDRRLDAVDIKELAQDTSIQEMKIQIRGLEQKISDLTDVKNKVKWIYVALGASAASIALSALGMLM